MTRVGVVVHDTVSADNQWDDEGNLIRRGTRVATELRIAREGVTQRRSDGTTRHIPGPLYNETISRSGKYWVITRAVANHAGRVDPQRLDMLKRRVKLPGMGQRASSSGGVGANEWTYGIALMRNGRGRIRPKQLDTLVERCVEACLRFGLTADQVVGHGELTGRKVDPGPVCGPMPEIRRRVRQELKEPSRKGR